MPLTDSDGVRLSACPLQQLKTCHSSLLPTRQAIVSPYIDARVDGGITIEKARNGIRRIAETSSGLVLNIAIQDGMGTGKGGAFSGKRTRIPQLTLSRQPSLERGHGATSTSHPTGTTSPPLLLGVSGTGAVLWANLEGMAPATDKNACADSLRGQTTKARLDRQLQQLGHAKKVISFMWDSYFTCKGPALH